MQPHIPLPPMAPYPQSADANLLQWMNPMMAPETFVESPEVSWHHQQQHQQLILNSQQARAGNCGKLFVGGLPATCGNEELREYFGKFGSIVDCVVMYDKENRHRGFGFVTFATAKEKEAVMSGYEKHYIGRKWIEVKRCIGDDAFLKTTWTFTARPNQIYRECHCEPRNWRAIFWRGQMLSPRSTRRLMSHSMHRTAFSPRLSTF